MAAVTMRPPGPGEGVRAYAKVNLSLEVLDRRSDGYHELSSVLQTVSLCDELTFRPAAVLSLDCDDPALEGPDNLAWRAAEALRASYGVELGAAMTLRKGVPVAAGLGGGSADAAAALMGLNALWGLGLTAGALAEAAARLGSDVPFFLSGGAALLEGRGERVTPLPAGGKRWLVLVVPESAVQHKTAAMYARLRPEHFTHGDAVAAVAGAIRGGGPWPEERMVNVFDAVADDAFPALAACRRAMEDVVGGSAHLSGAGPSLFALAPDEAACRDRAVALRQRGLRAMAVHTVAPSLGA
jgi:4-diphosphocytidyl-2-C-methyl-D-erythritol kinase